MKKSAIILLCFALASCIGEEHEDLKQWMKEATKDVRGKIPPLPKVMPYEPVPYTATGLDPFSSGKLVSEKKKSGSGSLQPDPNRPPEPLESYPLESIKYVGYMIQKKVAHAIVLVDGTLYQVKAGNYMGQNFGKITNISEMEIKLTELIQDADTDWEQRESTLLLQDQEGKK